MLSATGLLRAAPAPSIILSANLTGAPRVTTPAGAQQDPLNQVWPWASVSKQVTAVLAMQEVERGRLMLDSTLAEVLPAYRGTARDAVTVRQLMMHTSGLPNPEDTPPGSADSGLPAFYARTRGDRGGAADALGFCAGTPKARAGERFEYNNCDTLVLAAILERVAGMKFARLLEQRISRPLGLRTLAMDIPLARKRLGRTALQPVNYGAGGAMGGSLADLLAFDRALLSGKLLSPQSLAILWQGEPALGYVALGAWSFPAQLPGCKDEVALVERRGSLGRVQVRNLLAPALGRIVILVSDDPDVEYGEIWQGSGVTFEAAREAFCAPASR